MEHQHHGKQNYKMFSIPDNFVADALLRINIKDLKDM